MPWVHNHRSDLRRDGDPYAEKYLDCRTCTKRTPVSVRRGWNCGFLDRREWYGPGFPAPTEWGYRPEPEEGESPQSYRGRMAKQVCPGYLVALPQAIETALCNRWFEKGLLSERLDGQPITQLLRDSLDLLCGAIAEVEAHIMSKSSK